MPALRALTFRYCDEEPLKDALRFLTLPSVGHVVLPQLQSLTYENLEESEYELPVDTLLTMVESRCAAAASRYGATTLKEVIILEDYALQYTPSRISRILRLICEKGLVWRHENHAVEGGVEFVKYVLSIIRNSLSDDN
jgi:hypothetical protein